jgi:predicted glycosyltransferase
MQPMSFQPDHQNVDSVPIDVHDEVLKKLEAVTNELTRCRQKVAHLLREKELRDE